MRALQLTQDKTLHLTILPDPIPGPGEVLVDLRAAALNHRELWISKGMYPGMSLPSTLGADGAGIVSAVGDRVDPAWVGKRVILYPVLGWGTDEAAPTRAFQLLGMPGPGTIAEQITVPVENLVEKPDFMSWEGAAAIPVASLTAWRALTRHGRIQAGDNVLITGIGGGVAQAGLQLALAHKAKVYVTSSQPEKLADAAERGAAGGVNYREVGWTKEVRALSGGIDIVLDGSPLDRFDDYLHFLNTGARVTVYGSTGSPKTTIGLSRFFLRHLSLIGTAMGSPAEFRALIRFMAQHRIEPVIDRVFEIDAALDAFHYLGSGEQIGKVVVRISNFE